MTIDRSERLVAVGTDSITLESDFAPPIPSKRTYCLLTAAAAAAGAERAHAA